MIVALTVALVSAVKEPSSPRLAREWETPIPSSVTAETECCKILGNVEQDMKQKSQMKEATCSMYIMYVFGLRRCAPTIKGQVQMSSSRS